MNQEKSLEIFMRMARLVVGKHVTSFHNELAGSASYVAYNNAAQLMNGMQQINHALVTAAIKLIHKAKGNHDTDVELLTTNCKHVISGSIADYMNRV